MILIDTTLQIMCPPPQILPWLVYENSLTQKLSDIAGDARLNVLDQQWELPDEWDLSVLKLKLDTTSVMHREILMWAFDSPCWYARTILPDTTFQANTTLFNRLKTEPLGHLIFNGTEIQRASLTHYMISSSSLEYSWLNESMHQGSMELWVRLSEFTVKGRDSFFLLEILLPGLLRFLS